MIDKLRKLWTDQSGGLLSAEYLLLGTLLAIGLIVGVTAVEDALIEKISKIAAVVCQ